MSVPTQPSPQSSKHSQRSTSIAPGLGASFAQDHGLGQEDIDGLFGLDAIHSQDFETWSRQISTENTFQQDHGLFDEFWSSATVADRQVNPPMPMFERTSQHHPSKGSNPYYPIDELSSIPRLDYEDDDDELQAGADGATHSQHRQRGETSDNNSDDANSTKGDSPSDEKRKMQNRQAQRAFRERKMKYVQDLENRVKDLLLYIESLKHENQMLRARGQWLSTQLKNFHWEAPGRRTPS